MANVSASYVPNIYGRLSFPLQNEGNPIFYKKFLGDSPIIVDIDNDTITIPHHFFKTGEKLTYDYPYNGSPIKISPSSPGAGGTITDLPSTVYPIYIDENTIRVALASSLALQNQYVNITDVGIRSDHSLLAEKQNSKCLISIDNVIQSPMAVSGSVGIVTTNRNNASRITVSDLINIKVGTILKIGTEYTKVITIDYNTNELNLYRGTFGDPYLGSNTVNLSGFSTAYISVGNYNIVKDKIYFTDAPLEGTSYNIVVKTSNINYSQTGISSYSFNYFTNNYKTGSQVILYSALPPGNLQSGTTYFIIKNTENNFSFAQTYADALNNRKVGFTSENIDNITSLQLNQILPNENSSFHGRVFLRSNYNGNLVFDNISSKFNGVTTSFTLTSSGISTVGIKSDNGIVLINNIFQYPEFEESFVFNEDTNAGITSITFIGSVGQFQSGLGTTKNYDVNVGGRPRGGIIVGYGLTGGKNYQPAVRAEAVLNSLTPEGEVYSGGITISTPGSGYRSVSNYYVYFYDNDGNRLSGFGTAIIQNGSVTSVGIVSTFAPVETPNILIDSPISYENIPLSGSTSGIGALASFDINSNGDVSNFKIVNSGYGYTVGEILTPVGILTGINYTASNSLKIKINEVHNDAFSAWNIGELRKLDDLSSFVNGTRKIFTLTETIDGESQPISLETEKGSPIQLKYNILVFLNDVLQIPDSSYTFNRGTKIKFSEAPAVGSTLKVYVYLGSPNDTELVNIDPPIEIGDTLNIKKDLFNSSPVEQFDRTVKEILTSDTLQTEMYGKKGLSDSSSQLRSISWTPQKSDIILGGGFVNKSRLSLNYKVGIYTGIGTGSGTFVGVNTNTIGINTISGIGSMIQVGDYVESSYTGYGVTVSSIGSSLINIGLPGDLWKFDGETWINYGRSGISTNIIGEIENVQISNNPVSTLSSTFPSAISGDGVRDRETSIRSTSPVGINTVTIKIFRKS